MGVTAVVRLKFRTVWPGRVGWGVGVGNGVAAAKFPALAAAVELHALSNGPPSAVRASAPPA
ncbi:MAG: hypothetical protein FOGNACKC_06417 [Anaerolineae bacterium]|nr:hypothetical protein [Anaerolineae bacterium]